MDSDIKKRKCSVPVCGGEKFDLVHKFPMQPENAVKWKNILSSVLPELNELSIDVIRKKYCMCFRHFKNEDYKNIASRSLNKTSFPSLNLETLTEPHACPRLPPKPNSMSETLIEIPETEFVEIYEPPVDQSKSVQVQHVKRKLDMVVATATEITPAKSMKIIYRKNTTNFPENTSIMPAHHSSETLQISKNQVCFEVDPKLEILKVKTLHTPALNTVSNISILPIRNPAVQIVPKAVNMETEIRSSMNDLPTSALPIEQKLDVVSKILTTTIDNHSRQPAVETQLNTEDEQNNSSLSQSTEVTEKPQKKLVALFEVTAEQLLELQEKFNVETTQLLKGEVAKDDTMGIDYIELVSEKYPTPIRVNYLWLRDHCRCKKCYLMETFQRKIDLMDIPLDIVPEVYDFDDEQLHVCWKDGHESFYKMDFLYENQYDVHKQQVEDSSIVLWNQEQIEKADYARVCLSDLICNDEPIKIVMQSLIKYGIAFIEKVPANTQSTEMAIKRLFPIKKTLFGDMWTFSDSKDHSDTAYTKEFLPAHTDNTYFNDGAGLQVLHCIQHTGTGGLSLLQDGFKALKDFKEKHPDSYQRLSETSLTSEYIEEGQHHKYTAPIIKINPVTNEPEQIRFNTSDRAPINTIPLDKITQFYADYRKLTNEIQTTENEWWFKLNPGTVVVFDNWRVLHGRSEYQGKRMMAGCYVARTDFMSLARVLKLVS